MFIAVRTYSKYVIKTCNVSSLLLYLTFRHHYKTSTQNPFDCPRCYRKISLEVSIWYDTNTGVTQIQPEISVKILTRN